MARNIVTNQNCSFYGPIEQNIQQNCNNEHTLPTLFGVPERSDKIIGREEMIYQLYEHFKSAQTSYDRKVLITGMGGIGKTSLAIHCAFLWTKTLENSKFEKLFEQVIFINMDTAKSARSTFTQIAQLILKNTFSEIDCVREVYTFLDKKRTLFIFDNIEQYDVQKNYNICEFFPNDDLRTNIFILGTSQFTEYKQLFTCFPLDYLNKNTSLNLITSRISDGNGVIQSEDEETKKKLSELVILLGGHPLALCQAAAVIVDSFLYSDYSSMLTCISTFINEFNDHLTEDFPSGYDSIYRKPVYIALKMNIEKAILKEQARTLLFCLAFLNNFRINIEIFYEFFDRKYVKEAIRYLKKFSIIKTNANYIDIHRLIQEVCRILIKDSTEEESTLKKLLIILFNADESKVKWWFDKSNLDRLPFDYINKEKLQNIYEAAFNESRKRKRLIQELKKIDFTIDSTKNWPILYYSIFAKHEVLSYFILNADKTKQQKPSKCDWELYHICIFSESCKFINLEADIANLCAINGFPIFHFCAACNIDVHTFIKLFEMYNVNALDNNGNTALMWSLRNEHYDISLELIEKNADTQITNKSGQKAADLIKCTDYSKDGFKVIKHFIYSGTSISDFTQLENSILHVIAANGDTSFFHHVYSELSNKHNISWDLNAGDAKGNTCLHLAAADGDFDMVAYLIGNGADVNKLNEDEENCLHSYYKTNKMIKSPIVKLLIQHGTVITTANKNSQSCLMEMIQNNDTVAIEYFLDSEVEKGSPIKSTCDLLNSNNLECIAIKNQFCLLGDSCETKHVVFKSKDLDFSPSAINRYSNNLFTKLLSMYKQKERLSVVEIINFLTHSPDNQDVDFIMQKIIMGKKHKYFYKFIILIINTFIDYDPKEFFIMCMATCNNVKNFQNFKNFENIKYLLENYGVFSEIYSSEYQILSKDVCLGFVKIFNIMVLMHLEVRDKLKYYFFKLLNILTHFSYQVVKNVDCYNPGEWNHIFQNLKSDDILEYYLRNKLLQKSIILQVLADEGSNSWRILERFLHLGKGKKTLSKDDPCSILPEKYSPILHEVINLVTDLSENYAQVNKVRSLIKYGVNVNTPDHTGSTALHVAAASDQRKILMILVYYGVNLNIQNNQGNTAAHVAILSKKFYCLKLLLDLGTDSTIKNNAGKTVFDLLNSEEYTYIKLKNIYSKTKCQKDISFQYIFIKMPSVYNDIHTYMSSWCIKYRQSDQHVEQFIKTFNCIYDFVEMACKFLEYKKMSIIELLNCLGDSPDLIDTCENGKEYKAVYKLILIIIKDFNKEEDQMYVFCKTCFSDLYYLNYSNYLVRILGFEYFQYLTFSYWHKDPLNEGNQRGDEEKEEFKFKNLKIKDKTKTENGLPLQAFRNCNVYISNYDPDRKMSNDFNDEPIENYKFEDKYTTSALVNYLCLFHLEQCGEKQKIFALLLHCELTRISEFTDKVCDVWKYIDVRVLMYMSVHDIVYYYEQCKEEIYDASVLQSYPCLTKCCSSALHYAAADKRQGVREVIRRLIELGEDVNTSIFGITPLYLAKKLKAGFNIEELELAGAKEYV